MSNQSSLRQYTMAARCGESRRRASIRLEPELFEAFREIARRGCLSVGELYWQIVAELVRGKRTSAVRVYIVNYYRAAATEEGHIAVGHGADRGPEAHRSPPLRSPRRRRSRRRRGCVDPTLV